MGAWPLALVDTVTGPRPGSGMVFQYIGLFPWRTVEENIFFSKETQQHRTLTKDEVDKLEQKIKDALVKLGATIR